MRFRRTSILPAALCAFRLSVSSRPAIERHSQIFQRPYRKLRLPQTGNHDSGRDGVKLYIVMVIPSLDFSSKKPHG